MSLQAANGKAKHKLKHGIVRVVYRCYQLPALLGYCLPCWATACPAGLLSALLGYCLPCWATVCPAGLLSALLSYCLPCYCLLCCATACPVRGVFRWSVLSIGDHLQTQWIGILGKRVISHNRLDYQRS
eukprot:GHVS01062221.1.p2 GENE.GHVS01062221.1~~GHVS01062221.1.p2  ORF type:complete len:129 (-),score=11.18 GHVS01062221.1:627-1013(-)